VSAISDIEAVGSPFSIERLLDMRARTRRAVHAIADQIEVGMAEPEGNAIARRTLKKMGMRKGWHPIFVRFGANTAKDFLDRSEPGIVLGPDDIFFIDIGPVRDGMEGDAGDTFVTGGNPEHQRARADVHAIWADVHEAWRTQGLTGRALYDRARRASETRGWRLNMDLAGHRLSDFPHKAYHGGRLAETDIVPSAHLWILEIAIVHPTAPIGAFYEDLLLPDGVGGPAG
jgi:methionyl aminopeptidase